MIHPYSAPGAIRVEPLAAPKKSPDRLLEGRLLMFKHLSLVLMIGVLTLSLAACGGRKEDEEEEAPAKPAASGSTASAPSNAPAAAAPAAAAGGATLTGKVTFAGTAPQNELIKMDA